MNVLNIHVIQNFNYFILGLVQINISLSSMKEKKRETLEEVNKRDFVVYTILEALVFNYKERYHVNHVVDLNLMR